MTERPVIPYIGGKARLAGQIAKFLRATGADTIVDVFGGSGAVLLASGFEKRVYNDADGDLVNLFRVLASDADRHALLHKLRWLPQSRRIFDEDYHRYLCAGGSFAGIADRVERARATFYRQHFVFGGKGKCGGFVCSTGDRGKLKEAHRYVNVLRRLVNLGRFWRETVLENLDYLECIRIYGGRRNVVLFCDPPYLGKSYYPVKFGLAQHVFLASALNNYPAAAVVTHYEDAMIREFYPEPRWQWTELAGTKNRQRFCGQRRQDKEWFGTTQRTAEWVIVKRWAT